MKKLALLLLSTPLISAPGIPFTIFIGKMSCSARSFSGNQVQTWCTKGTKLIHNTLQDISKDGYLLESFTDATQDEPFANICWMFVNEGDKIRWEATWQIGTSTKPNLLSGILAPAK